MRKDKKTKIIDKITDKLTILNQKQIDYLTKKFVFNKAKQEQKRSVFITEKIKAWQKKLLFDVKITSYNQRMKTQWGNRFEKTFAQPAIVLFLIFQDMQQDIQELDAESHGEIIERLKNNDSLDTDGTIVTAFVQNERQNIVDRLKKVFYTAPSIEAIDKPQNKNIKRKICYSIFQFIAITQATVDLGNFSPDLHYTWGVWFAHSDFTFENYIKTVKSILENARNRGLPNTTSMLGLTYTQDFQNVKRISDNHKALKKGRKINK